MATKMPEMNWKHDPIAESFIAFKARMQLYLEDNEIDDAGKQATKIKIAIGDEGMRRLLASGLTNEEQRDPEAIYNMLEEQLDATVKISYRVHRLEFIHMQQNADEAITDFVARLRNKAAKCEFDNVEKNERLVEMVIKCTPFEDLRKELFPKPKGFAINKVIEKAREYEALTLSQASLKSMSVTPSKFDAIRKGHNKCGNCGLQHAPRSCPAYNDECRACGTKGHWEKHCRKSKRGRDRGKSGSRSYKHRSKSRGRYNKGQYQKQNKQDEVQFCDTDGETYSKSFYSITISDLSFSHINRDEAYTSLIINHDQQNITGPLKVKIDTGSGGNTLPLRTYRQMFGHTPFDSLLTPEPSTRLTSYTNTNIKCFGSLNLNVRKPQTTCFKTQKFYVVDVPGPAILGLPTCELLDLVTINVDGVDTNKSNRVPITQSVACQPNLSEVHKDNVPTPEKNVPPPKSPSPGTKVNSITDLKLWYPDCFDKIGCFSGEEDIFIRPDAMPFIDPPRRCSIHLKPKIQAELTKMENLGIIRKVTKHTDWCSSITYAIKKDGSLRVCLDPKRLNQSIRRCPHKIPTVEEISPAFSKAKFFSKLDAKAGYWSIKLSEKSQELTTFRTPFGRFCFQRLPFGLSISQDLFQQRMDNIIEQCDGVVGISDDIVVYGETEEQHDTRLIHFFQIARKEGLSLNSTKCTIKVNNISFFGRLYTDKGVLPDPTKVEDIVNMPTPENKQDLQRFLGMVTFLSSHIPNFSDKSAPLRELLKETVPFEFSEDHQNIFTGIKQQVASNTNLQYYDPNTDVNLEVDASLKGLGAALVQQNGPVAFASKTLTTTQSNYSNIERECLAIVHGIQRFHHYLYGKRFTVVTDHKPLEMIFTKPIHAAPPRLQRMLLKIQGYDFDVVYRPGSQMILADTLSRLPNQSKQEDIELDCRVDSILIDSTHIDLMNF